MDDVRPPRRHDYTREFTASHRRQPPAEVPPAAKHPKKRRRYLFIGLLVLVLIATGGAGWLLISRNANPIPPAISQSANFQLYYPSSLPAGYILDTSSFANESGGGFNFKISSAQSNNSIVISEQAAPKGFDFNGFYKNSINETSSWQTSQGQAVIGTLASRQLGSLATPSTWILVSAPQNWNPTFMSQVLNSLKAVSN